MYCEKCGTYNDEDAVFCVNCGQEITAGGGGASKNNGSNKMLIIIIICIFVVVIAAVCIFLMLRMKDGSKDVNEEYSLESALEELEDIEDSDEEKESEIEEFEIDEYDADDYDADDYEIEEYKDPVYAISMSDIVDVSATSILVEKARTHYAERIIDGDLTKAWTEGAEGTGAGEAVTLYFDDVYKIQGFYIHAGYHKSEKLYWENARPRTIEITSDGVYYGEYSLRDYLGEQEIVFSEPIEGSNLTITIRDVYEGTKYKDAVISEIYLY